MTFNKKAKKGEIISKVKAYRESHRAFEDAGLWSGRFTLDVDPAEITWAFIAENMTAVTSGEAGKIKPYPTTHYQSSAFPELWVKASTQAIGELDKVVGFPSSVPGCAGNSGPSRSTAPGSRSNSAPRLPSMSTWPRSSPSRAS